MTCRETLSRCWDDPHRVYDGRYDWSRYCEPCRREARRRWGRHAQHVRYLEQGVPVRLGVER